MITASSVELAHLFNQSRPATAEDATETPRDWTGGICIDGTVYEVDAQATTDTRLVLADGTAAIEWSPKGTCCRGEHRVGHLTGHWCVADTDDWTSAGDARGVRRDWRSVYVWDGGSFSETTVYDTVEKAKAAFAAERDELERLTDELNAEYGDEDVDDYRY